MRFGVLILLLTGVSAHAMECVGTHLREAIALNQERMPLYAALSDGATKRISRRLIWAERFALLTSRGLDRAAAKFHAHGIGILCDELLPMSDAPKFSSELKPLSYDYQSIDSAPIKRVIRDALKTRDFERIEAIARLELNRLQPVKEMHCMYVHLLETIERAARLAPAHARAAAALSLESPAAISNRMISDVLKLLGAADRLDESAAPAHKRGIPIICQDVP